MKSHHSKDDIPSSFQFVTITKPGQGWKNKNEHIVRSHVMRQLRQKQRAQKSQQGKKDDDTVILKSQSESSSIRERDSVTPPEEPWRATQAPSMEQNANANMLQLRLPASTEQLSIRDQRLLGHISEFYSPLVSNVSPKFVLWTRGIQDLVNIAVSCDFLLHAVLGWSATHLAHVTGDQEIQQDAYMHRCEALRGLQVAIKSFSKENSDAVLCASIVMAWQSSDANGWATMMRGCQTVKAKMVAWETSSNFYSPGQDHDTGLDSNNIFNREVMMKALAIPNDAIHTTETLLQQCLWSLGALRQSLDGPPELCNAVDRLATYVEFVHNSEYADPAPTRAELLTPLRSMLFWFPSRFISMLHAGPDVMLLIAHLHAIALLVDPVQDTETAFFRRLNVAPIQSFHEEFSLRAALEVGQGKEGQYSRALNMMDFPLSAVAAFERRLLEFSASGQPSDQYGEIKAGVGWVNYDGGLSSLKILENFPVGLWHNSLS